MTTTTYNNMADNYNYNLTDSVGQDPPGSDYIWDQCIKTFLFYQLPRAVKSFLFVCTYLDKFVIQTQIVPR